MPIVFQIPDQVIQPQTPDPTLIGGSDVSLKDGDTTTTAGGDWALLAGVDAAWQSVVRESLSPNRSFPQRPDYGAGVTTLLLKGQTRAIRDQIVAAIRVRLRQNPRVRRVLEVRCDPSLTGQGVVVLIRADAVDGPITLQIPITTGGR